MHPRVHMFMVFMRWSLPYLKLELQVTQIHGQTPATRIQHNDLQVLGVLRHDSPDWLQSGKEDHEMRYQQTQRLWLTIVLEVLHV